MINGNQSIDDKWKSMVNGFVLSDLKLQILLANTLYGLTS